MLEKLLKMAEAASESSEEDSGAAAALATDGKSADDASKGIKETIEVIEAVTLVTVFLTKRIKDGIGADDAMALMQKIMTDPEFLAVFTRAADGIGEIPGELSDLDFEESITLGILGLSFIKEVVKALRED